ncbi:hypothetical protein NIES4074_50830 [Cylindrospermum sp. NIES-4074]|nr:hypothetical protein NIES4074_50830 [Cylindrospermum sp. NIES-4074]
MTIDDITRALVRKRAKYLCEYCHPSDYEDADIEDLMKKLHDFWQDFIKNDFLAIEKIINTNTENIINKDVSPSS